MSAEAWPFGAVPPGYVAALKFSVSVANTAEKPHKYWQPTSLVPAQRPIGEEGRRSKQKQEESKERDGHSDS